MTDFLPPGIFRMALEPIPVWPLMMDPWFPTWSSGNQLSILEVDFPAAVCHAFDFLLDAGFSVIPRDNWDTGPEGITLALEREDIVLFFNLDRQHYFHVLVTGRVDGDSHLVVRERLSAVISSQVIVAKFGSFPLLATDPAIALDIVRHYAGGFRTAVQDLLATEPSNVIQLSRAISELVRMWSRENAGKYLRSRAEAAWNRQNNFVFLDFVDRLRELDRLTEEELSRVELSSSAAIPSSPLQRRSGETHRDWFGRVALLVTNKNSEVKERALHRDEGSDQLAAWEDSYFELREANTLLYSDLLGSGITAVRAGDPESIDYAVAFLEADPWCLRSGYAKEAVIRSLLHIRFDDRISSRLREVILHSIDVGDRREFRSYCKLASRLPESLLRKPVRERLHSADAGISRRALWMIEYLGGAALNGDDLRRAQEILLQSAGDRHYWRVSEWISRLAEKYRTPSWMKQLCGIAVDFQEPDQPSALKLISSLRSPGLTDDQRDVLRALLIEAIDEDFGHDWIERVALIADTPGLRVELAQRQNSTSEVVRQYSQWALGAILRAHGTN